MDLGLSEIQKMLQESSRNYLEENCTMDFVRAMESDDIGISDEIWKNMAEMGWLGLMIPEEFGGSGFNFEDMSILLEEMGRVGLSGPFFSTAIIGVQTLLLSGDEKQKKEILPKISTGEIKITLAFNETAGSFDESEINSTFTTKNHDGWTLNGEKLFVNDAKSADYFVVASKSENNQGLSLFLVPANSEGIEIEKMDSIGGDKIYKVKFSEIKLDDAQLLGEDGDAWNTLSEVFRYGAAGKSSEMSGAASKVMDMTLDYIKDRKQFDRPIGSFQAVQHHAADMAILTKVSTQFARKAAWKLSNSDESILDVNRSKAYVSKAFHDICQISHQLHGAIGYTWDYDLQVFTRKMQHQKLSFGDAEFHHKKISNLLELN
ncbi:MAG: acyl-CoA dehydrogenase family protein [Chloroflexota bacterium]|nr:acyl-CoA dehydrogenase family protein [Chloroflexota bacterium]